MSRSRRLPRISSHKLFRRIVSYYHYVERVLNTKDHRRSRSVSKGTLNRNYRLPRCWSNQLLKIIAPILSGEVINVSGWNDQDKEGSLYREYFVNAKSYYISNFSGERGLDDTRDITNFNIDLSGKITSSLVGKFDVVLNHTTLEHIFDILTAFNNLCALSCDVVILVVPFAQPIHYTSSYGDFWRFTPMTLRELFSRNEMEVIFEAANRDENAGIYLFFVGSKKPEKWRSKMPEWEPINELGDWIGVKRVNHFSKFFKKSTD